MSVPKVNPIARAFRWGQLIEALDDARELAQRAARGKDLLSYDDAREIDRARPRVKYLFPDGRIGSSTETTDHDH